MSTWRFGTSDNRATGGPLRVVMSSSLASTSRTQREELMKRLASNMRWQPVIIISKAEMRDSLSLQIGTVEWWDRRLRARDLNLRTTVPATRAVASLLAARNPARLRPLTVKLGAYLLIG